MTIDEMRGDGFAWVFVRQHYHLRPRLKQIRRRRRILLSLVAAGAFLGLSAFGVALLNAGPNAATTATGFGTGGVEIWVRPEAGATQVVREVRAALDDRKLTVRVETQRARAAIEGRLYGDGDGIVMLDSDPAFDLSATKVTVSSGASGVISILIASDGELDVFDASNTCDAYGRSYDQVRFELEQRGFDVEEQRLVLDSSLDDSGYAVWNVLVSGERALVFTRSFDQLPEESPRCG